MKTHENADTEENQIDFCWGVPHENLHNVYSDTVINGTPKQAFVSGYREGVKMSLDRGAIIQASNFSKQIQPQNLRTLSTWMSVGADVENGLYAMLGARVGCWMTAIKGMDTKNIRSLSHIYNLFDNLQLDVEQDIMKYGNSLRQRLAIPLADFDADESKFFKFCQGTWNNKGVQDREYQ
jgi:hypothetical protein